MGYDNGVITQFNTLLNQCGKPWLKPNSNNDCMVTALQYSPRNTTSLAAAYIDGSVILWDTNKDAPSCSFKTHNAPCTSIAFSPLNIMLMVSAGLDSNINIYDIQAKKYYF